MSSEQRDQQEPSMEEILSSIRRIIADEEAEDDKPRVGAARDEIDDEDDDEDEDVLELTKVVHEEGGEVHDLQSPSAADAPPPGAADDDEGEPAPDYEDDEVASSYAAPAPAEDAEPPAVEAEDDIEITSAQTPPAPEPAKETRAVPPSSAATQNLISDTAATAATGAFARLSKAYQRTPEEDSVADGSGRSVEQFIEDMIRPMLKEWLDENMPPLVERLVEKEIQKLARRSELI